MREIGPREARGLGFEPRLTEPKSVVLPLHYPRNAVSNVRSKPRRTRSRVDRYPYHAVRIDRTLPAECGDNKVPHLGGGRTPMRQATTRAIPLPPPQIPCPRFATILFRPEPSDSQARLTASPPPLSHPAIHQYPHSAHASCFFYIKQIAQVVDDKKQRSSMRHGSDIGVKTNHCAGCAGHREGFRRTEL